MNKLIAIVMMFVISFAVLFYGCKKSDHNDYGELAKEEAEIEANLKIASDSMVSLSFCGITLGEPISPMLSKAMKDKKIWDIKQNRGNGVICFRSNVLFKHLYYFRRLRDPSRIDRFIHIKIYG